MYNLFAHLARGRDIYIDGTSDRNFDGNHSDMRLLLVNYVYNNWDEENFRPLFLTGIEGKTNIGEQEQEIFEDKNDYKTKMLDGVAWGGFTEMMAFEKIFQVKVYIVRPTKVGLALYAGLVGAWLQECDLDNFEMSNREVVYAKDPKNVFLYHANMDHFDVLVPTVTEAAADGS